MPLETSQRVEAVEGPPRAGGREEPPGRAAARGPGPASDRVALPVSDIAGARPPGRGATVDRRPVAGDPESDADAPTPAAPADPAAPRAACTAPQLRRFIKSRAYVPMHELRRRFAINGEDDDVCAVDVDAHRIFVGLPPAEGRLLGELLRNGEVGYELSMDPETPIVVGVYSMRPVSRS